MGFDDFFENDYKHHKHGHDHNYGNDDYHYGHQNDLKYILLNKVKANPKLRLLLITGAIILIIILITIIVLLIPFIIRVLNFFMENGIQGLIDVIWKGTR
jgi:hypothetical protein